MLTLQRLQHCFHHPKQSSQSTQLCFDLKVETGDIVALLGPSGAGKSTLLAMVAGFLAPDSGKLTVNGHPIEQLHPAKRPLSILFQEHNLFPHLSVYENIGLGLSPALKLSNEQKEDIIVAAEKVGLQGYLDRLPEQLSGGQRQRVALARCLIRQRPLLLLDEPFSALDPALRKEMLELVRKLAREQGTTVLMVTHSPEDALKIADKCAFICQGQVKVFGPSQDILVTPSDPALTQYLGH
ncbi:thiamine ABC transporter ATP-binding protein [Photobacterium sp. DNB23_23_1]|uniref:Thiamine ABC transporter ATP-binding protein n=1 Tax=Photobacterium pectinilyticum TaxID=2906793 RepID=A0ABT1N4G5_9GAMM|nr:thiamine ABC transporter ATP-binding protein [Photobacterium sp. ZSDE20]MCQ1059007.1 thiamine ABC transporter ATP-binding protein [Photobacterium sp. ZSDE20]MDD1824143.1 thiamine ABC transporter ATP-binding protein [Photobacterium sp. ZSDE20]